MSRPRRRPRRVHRCCRVGSAAPVTAPVGRRPTRRGRSRARSTTARDGPCNSGGVSGVTVEITYAQDDPKGRYLVDEVQPGGLLKTNDAGNFYSAARFVSPMKVRIYSGTPQNPGKQAQMTKFVGVDASGAAITVDRNACHYPNSPDLPGTDYGRIFLQ